MNIVSFKAILVGAILALTGNSTLMAARNWFDAGVYSAIALGSGIIARESYYYYEGNPQANIGFLHFQNALGFSIISGAALVCAVNALRNKQEELPTCRQ